jgi:hypothetical protein
MRRIVGLATAVAMLCLAVLGCSLPGFGEATPTATEEPAGAAEEATQTPWVVTATAEPATATPAPTSTAPPEPVVPTSDRPTLPPATPVPPTPTEPASEGPIIELFTANVEEADPGDTVVLEWATTGATEASITKILATGQYGQFWPVEPDGYLEYAIPSAARNSVAFELNARDDEDRAARQVLRVRLRCPDNWFFEPPPDECPSGPAVRGPGAEEHFERGVMIWSEAKDRVYVLFEDGDSPAWRAYPDLWEEGMADSDPGIVPPPGRYQPIRGFGLVWREQLDVRDRLGWAADREAAYDVAIQSTSRFKYNDTYILARDGGVWVLGPEGSRWYYRP